MVADSENPELIGQHFKAIHAEGWEQYLAQIKAGKSTAALNPKNHRFEVFAPIELGRTGKPWSIMIRVKQETVLADALALDKEITSAGHTSMTMLGLAGLVTCVLAVLLLWYAAGSIVRPIQGTVTMLKDIAEGEGDLTKRLEITSQDEIGDMGRWFNVFMEKLQGVIEDVAQNTGTLNEASSNLSAIATELTTNAESMSGRSNGVATAAEDMNANMNNVAAASEQAATNVNMVASATEEMTSTVREIATNISQASIGIQDMNDNVGQSSTAAGSISDDIVEVNQSVQEVTNASGQVNLNVEELSKLAENLQDLVGRFKV